MHAALVTVTIDPTELAQAQTALREVVIPGCGGVADAGMTTAAVEFRVVTASA